MHAQGVAALFVPVPGAILCALILYVVAGMLGNSAGARSVTCVTRWAAW